MRSSVSASMISAIERGTKSPTVSILSKLAAAMAVPISALVDGTHQTTPRIVVRRARLTTGTSKSKAPRRVTLNPAVHGSNLEFLRYTVPPRVLAGPFAGHTRGTIEHIHLARGQLRIVCGEDQVLLEAGDSCSCHTDVPHAFDNRQGKAEALLYIVTEPPLANPQR
jgi:mannose-6-phosphate isomerase-like protein (cupin superfamily)